MQLAWDLKRTGDAMTGDSATSASLASDSVLKGHFGNAIALMVLRCASKGDLQAGFVLSEPPLTTSESVEGIIRFGDELVTNWDWYEQQLDNAYWVGVAGYYSGDMAKKLSPRSKVLFRYPTLWHDQLTFGFDLPADTRSVVAQVQAACPSKSRR
jgi:hypothetical protein